MTMHKTLISFSLVAATLIGTSSPVYANESGSKTLSTVLAGMPDKAKARFDARHPQQTLDFFGVKPGMTVLEALPGGGWYSKVLLPYLGENGVLLGADYAVNMYPKFGFFSKEQLKEKETWVADWTKEANGWRNDHSAKVQAFNFGSMPKNLNGTADAVLFIRALHNLARFENDGGYLSAAFKDAYDSLKPGGIVGVVQHMIPESADDKGADGSRGYLKKSFLIAAMEKAGFKFVASSDINLNPKDQPSATDIVWRLPPTYFIPKKDANKKAEYTAVGESNRMTLKFVKP